MARALQNISCYIKIDKDGNPQGSVIWDYAVADGTAKKKSSLTDDAPDFGKTFHNTGAVGEFWRDGVDAIKTAENI